MTAPRHAPSPVGRVVASIHEPEAVRADGTRELDWSDLDASLAPAPERAAAPERSSERTGWLAPLVFLLGLLLALGGLVFSLIAAALTGVLAVWLWLQPGAQVPHTGPGPVPEGPETEFIIVPETQPARSLPVEEATPAPKAPARKRVEARQVPVAPVEPPAPPPAAPVAPPVAEPRGAAAKISLESVPLDEAILRVHGKAGRGEARAAQGQ